MNRINRMGRGIVRLGMIALLIASIGLFGPSAAAIWKDGDHD